MFTTLRCNKLSSLKKLCFFVVRKSAVPLMALLYLLVAYYGKCRNKTKQNSALLPLSINMNACIFENCLLCSDLIVQSTLLLSLPCGRKWDILPSPVENQLSYIEEAYSQNLGKEWEMKAKQIRKITAGSNKRPRFEAKNVLLSCFKQNLK